MAVQSKLKWDQSENGVLKMGEVITARLLNGYLGYPHERGERHSHRTTLSDGRVSDGSFGSFRSVIWIWIGRSSL
jgi:hypothetical protein